MLKQYICIKSDGVWEKGEILSYNNEHGVYVLAGERDERATIFFNVENDPEHFKLDVEFPFREPKAAKSTKKKTSTKKKRPAGTSAFIINTFKENGQIRPTVKLAKKKFGNNATSFRHVREVVEQWKKDLVEEHGNDFLKEVEAELKLIALKYNKEQREARKQERANDEKELFTYAKTKSLEEWYKYIAEAMTKKMIIPKFEKSKYQNEDESLYFFSDIHFGEDTEKTEENFRKMTQMMADDPATNIRLYCLGDIVENAVVGGTMHPNQGDQLDLKSHEIKTYIVEQFMVMFTTLSTAGKKVKFLGIGGNHDRYTKNRDEDTRREFACDIYMILQYLANSSDHLDVSVNNIDTPWGADFTNDDYSIVFHHGDGYGQKLMEGKPESVVLNHGRPGTYNLLVFGDKHHIHMDEGKGYSVVGLPAVSPQNHYAAINGFHAMSGFMKAKWNGSSFNLSLIRF